MCGLGPSGEGRGKQDPRLLGRSASRQAVLKSCRFPADLPCVMARLWPGRQNVQVSNVFNIWRLQDSLDYEKYLQAFTNVWFGRRKTSNTPELFRGSGVMLTVPFTLKRLHLED